MTCLSRYGTLDTRTERRLTNGHDKARGCTKIVSKTTYKLKKFNGANSELDSAGEENYERSNGLELMEIPLSPTHYDQPPTPGHAPPLAWEVESAIHSMLSSFKSEYNPRSSSSSSLTASANPLPFWSKISEIINSFGEDIRKQTAEAKDTGSTVCCGHLPLPAAQFFSLQIR